MIHVDILQIVGLGIIASVIIIILKTQRPEMAIQVSMLTGVVIFLLVAGKISSVIDILKSYASKTSIDMAYISILLKIIGITYITEFGAEVCKDAGEASIASKIELAGKVVIILMAIPIITSLLDLITKIMP
jgi:stage III sporulation protein AD